MFAAAVALVLERQAALRADGRRGQADLPLREVCAELATALRLSDAAVQRRLGDAASLCEGFPATFAVWERGELDAGQVAAILSAGVPLTAGDRARYEPIVLDAAATETAGRLQHLARTVDAALGGATSIHNLAHLCRRHHTLKHDTAWTVRQREGGIIEWRSPTGRTHHDRPAATVRFVPDTTGVGGRLRVGARARGDGDPPPF